MKPTATAASALFVALAAIVACDESPADSNPDSDVEIEFRNGTDPSALGPLPTCVSNWNHDGIAGEVHFPSLNACVHTLDAPLAVLLRGNGYSYAGYDFLLQHLASWGYIAVSINVLAPAPDEHADPTADALDYLDDFSTNWPMASHIDTDSLALIGHSRGGGTVRHLADALAGEGDPWTVRALVVMAGTNADELDVDADMTDGLLVMHAGPDADVTAAKGVRLYDRAGSETSQAAWSPRFDKAFKLFAGGTHKGFAGQKDLGAPDQGLVARGYVLAFLRGRIQGDQALYDDYVVGGAVPATWPSRIVSQYSDAVRKVVDNGEDGSWSTSTIGGVVKVSNAQVVAIDLEADATSEHSTRALQLRASNAGGNATWFIPTGSGNVGAYENLDFRVLIDANTTTTNLFVEIQRGGAWSAPLAVSDYTEIATRVAGPFAGTYIDAMASVRVPLVDFGGAGDVQAIRLSCQGDAVNRWFTIDNLEFATNAFGG